MPGIPFRWCDDTTCPRYGICYRARERVRGNQLHWFAVSPRTARRCAKFLTEPPPQAGRKGKTGAAARWVEPTAAGRGHTPGTLAGAAPPWMWSWIPMKPPSEWRQWPSWGPQSQRFGLPTVRDRINSLRMRDADGNFADEDDDA